MKILFSLLFLTFTACEFRPPPYEFQDLGYPIHPTKCYYPITEIHNYDFDSSTITECYYTSSETVKEELTFDVATSEIVGMVTYQYKRTYYLKTVYDYINGSQESHYITGVYYIDTESV